MPHDHSHDDFAFEHAPGLPEPLPRGEHLLWQGRPNAWRLAVESLALRWVIAYFAFLAFWRVGSAMADHPASVALASAVPLAVLCAAAVAILYGFSWVQARQAVYSVTTHRVILRIGAALQVTLQIPFSRIENITLDLREGGSGTIAFETAKDGGKGLSYLVMWPHVRPWHTRMPQPAFRCIAQAQEVAELLADAAAGQMARPVLAPAADADAPAAPAAAQEAARRPGRPAAVPAE